MRLRSSALASWVILASALTPLCGRAEATAFSRFPADKAVGINPDTHLVLTFPSPPTLGESGQIRVYDAANHRLVDMLDTSIPAGPDPTWRGQLPPRWSPNEGATTRPNAAPKYQVNKVGEIDGFHFHPVIIHGNVATINLHNNRLEYGHTYIVQIDPGVLTSADGGFSGVDGDSGWTFSTKTAPPSNDVTRVVVAADGTGDFNTVQGAIEFVPDNPPRRVTIFIKKGSYEEIVYFRHKTNLTIRGEDREKVQVGCGNSSLFNPPSAAHVPSTAFTVVDSTGIELINFSLSNYYSGQAGALYISGDKNILSHMNIIRSGDALQTRGRLYVTDSKIVGEGDSIIGSGPAFFKHCEIHSWGCYVWPRNPRGNHGYIFVDCTFETPDGPSPLIGAGPVYLAKHSNDRGGQNWPDAEMVLINCRLKGLPPVGWGPVDGETSNLHFWEYNSTNLDDGKPVDVSKRRPASKQLSMEHDSQTITNYANPAYVLEGWTPVVGP